LIEVPDSMLAISANIWHNTLLDWLNFVRRFNTFISA